MKHKEEIESFFKINILDKRDVLNTWILTDSTLSRRIEDYNDFIRNYNENFIRVQLKKHGQFFDGNKDEEDQRRAILTNDTNTLVIAGPGSGKTTTLVDRVAYYVLKEGIKPADILVLAYGKSAKADIEKKILEKYHIQIEIRTFHSLGFKMLKLSPTDVLDASIVMSDIIQDMKRHDQEYQRRYVDFLSHFPAEDGAESDTKRAVLESKLAWREYEPYIALDETRVRSIPERDIANFFIKNQIPYKYEQIVTWCDKDSPLREYKPDFYLPDYDIYIECWMIKEGEQSPEHYTIPLSKIKKYEDDREWKRGQFIKHGKILWEVYASDNLDGRLQSILVEKCGAYGIPLRPRSNEELLDLVKKERMKFLDEAIQNTITTAKVTGLNIVQLTHKVHEQSTMISPSEAMFYTLVEPIFEKYEERLRQEGKIDFEDMINKACELLYESGKGAQDKGIAAYKMIFIDEFQDISLQRLKLVKLLAHLDEDCRVFCVGDDWQGIYGFAGSSCKYFVDFEKYAGACTRVLLHLNHRNPQSVINFGQQVIAKCKEKNIDKRLISKQTEIQSAIQIHRLNADNDGVYWNTQAKEALSLIKELVRNHVDPGEIMVLSRFRIGYAMLRKNISEQAGDIPVALEKDGKIIKSGVRFHTIHKSKGLESSIVILLNVNYGFWGFPPSRASLFNAKLINPDLPEREDEERRLFFVALTRAKKRVHIFTWIDNESLFLPPPVKIFNDMLARIIDTTDKAVHLEVDDNTYIDTVWVARSMITSVYDDNSRELKRFSFTPWLLEKGQRNSRSERVNFPPSSSSLFT